MGCMSTPDVLEVVVDGDSHGHRVGSSQVFSFKPEWACARGKEHADGVRSGVIVSLISAEVVFELARQPELRQAQPFAGRVTTWAEPNLSQYDIIMVNVWPSLAQFG